jgi:glycosyltransferase involved in cell wall biosynthesis
MPLVDVICSVYNPTQRFFQTVRSVLGQSHRNLRLVVVDDGSNQDEALQLLAAITQLDDRIRLVRHPQNRGLTLNLVDQVEASTADFIARIDSGDEWLPAKLEQQLALMQRYPNALVVGTQCVYVNEESQAVGRSWFAQTPSELQRAIAQRRGVFEHSSIVFRRGLNYRPEFRMSQDLDLYLRASLKGELHCVPCVLTRCEINLGGLTLQKRYLQRKYQALAYLSYLAVRRGRPDVPLYIQERPWEQKLWHKARPHYVRYVNARTQGRPVWQWGPALLCSLVLYPPLLKDYSLKVLGACWGKLP